MHLVSKDSALVFQLSKFMVLITPFNRDILWGSVFFSLSGSLGADFSICGFGSINVQNQGQTKEKATEGHWPGHQMVSWMLVGEHESRTT